MKELSANPVAVVGTDLAKRSFHACAVDAKGKCVFSKKLDRARLVDSCRICRRWGPARARTLGHARSARTGTRSG